MTCGVVPLFIEIARADIALLKFLFESYEGVAVIRTLDRHKAIIVALVSADFLDVARGMLSSLVGSLEFREVEPPNYVDDEWLTHFALGQEPPNPENSEDLGKRPQV